MHVTRAITHIRLCAANYSKLAVVDALAAEYVRLCQRYTTYFSTDAEPDSYCSP
jgi:hypothetical protein